MSHFTTIQTQVRDLEALRDACNELGLELKTKTACRGYAGQTRKCDHIDLKSIGVIHVVRATDIAFNANTQQWEVTRFGKDEVIFTDPTREECVRWEMANLRPEDEQAVEP